MEPRQKLALMDKIIRELDDLRNSQTSVLKKISQIEADNINLASDLLANSLPDVHEEVDDAVIKITALLEQFRNERTVFQTNHPIDETAT